MRKRVAGILRVKNEGKFIQSCIESCIQALDELVVVYNDCTDNSAEEIEKMFRKYPNKIRYYAYPHKIKAVNLTREEYEELKNASEDNPHLLSTYCNFALSKVTADYALKIDADQIYFTFKLKEWCDFMRNCQPLPITKKVFIGKMFSYYLSLFRLLSIKLGIILPMMPNWLLKTIYPSYISYAKYAFSHDEACMALSGLNVIETTDRTLISMGHASDKMFLLPPFNGIGDTVMFKVNDKVGFRKFIDNNFNNPETNNFFLAEEFIHPYKKITYIGYFWKHIRSMRPDIFKNVLDVYKKDNEAFIDIDSFKKLSYRKILKHSPKNIFLPFQRILFEFIYKANKQDLFNSLENEILGGH